MIPPKLLFCNGYNAKYLFLLLKASHFGITKPSKKLERSTNLVKDSFVFKNDAIGILHKKSIAPRVEDSDLQEGAPTGVPFV